jgi:hypothetical protein
MWDKCGTKILNEINKVKKSKLFFGSAIYQFLSVFNAKYQFSSYSGLKGLALSVFVSFALRSVYLHPCPVC